MGNLFGGLGRPGNNRGATSESIPVVRDKATESKKETERYSRKDVPKEFMPARRREVLTTMCGFTETVVTMVSYVPKRNRAVVLMSTLHSSVTYDPSSKMKPNIIQHYNSTKSGVDVLDQLVKEYTCKRGTRRWTVIVFYNIHSFICIRQRGP